MKLAVIIPAYNEEKTIARVIGEIFANLEEYSDKYVIVVNDGSQDQTAAEAKAAGVHKIINNKQNFGLAYSLRIGLEAALAWGADIIVNTDADGQYNQADIKNLISLIQVEEADLVIGNRQVWKLKHMPYLKRIGNQIGSWVIKCLTGIRGIDASSGFRAYSREAAMKINIYFGHTYTHQTIIEAAYKKLVIKSVPVEFRPRPDGQSRLIKNIWFHISVSIFVIIRTLLVYKPLKTFISLALVFLLSGLALGVRFLYYFFFVSGEGKVQSLILTAILLILGILFFILGLLGDLIAINRHLNEDIRYNLKKNSYDGKNSAIN